VGTSRSLSDLGFSRLIGSRQRAAKSIKDRILRAFGVAEETDFTLGWMLEYICNKIFYYVDY